MRRREQRCTPSSVVPTTHRRSGSWKKRLQGWWSGVTSLQQAKSLDREAIRAYYRSELFERIEKSARVRREFAFQAQLGAEQLQTVLPNIGEHRVTVQGIADLIFEEADGWTLVDFKTDRVADGAVLLQRYREQLELYAQMLSKTNGIPICRKVIYSLFLHREIEVE